MKAALVSYLLDDTALADLVARRIHWRQRPQAESLPAIALLLVSAPQERVHGGVDPLCRSRIQFDLWGRDEAECTALDAAVRAAMFGLAETRDGVRFQRAFLDTAADDPPEDLGGGRMAWRTRHDWLVWHQFV